MSGQSQKTESDNGVCFVVAGGSIQLFTVSKPLCILASFDISVISIYPMDLSLDIVFASIGDKGCLNHYNIALCVVLPLAVIP